MRRGEIYSIDFEPIRGAEANKVRPAVVISNNQALAAAARAGRGVVTVVPLTSNTTKVLSFQVFLPRDATGLPVDSKAQSEQIRSVALERVGEYLGVVPPDLLDELSSAVRRHLDV